MQRSLPSGILRPRFDLRRLGRFRGRHRFGCHLVHSFEALFIGAVRAAFSRARASTFRVISMSFGSIPSNASAIMLVGDAREVSR